MGELLQRSQGHCFVSMEADKVNNNDVKSDSIFSIKLLYIVCVSIEKWIWKLYPQSIHMDLLILIRLLSRNET